MDVQKSDAGLYECQASSKHHMSTAVGTISVEIDYKFEVIVTPSRQEVEIGESTTFTCNIYPPASQEINFSYKWSRVDTKAMPLSTSGVNSNMLRVVSFSCLKVLMQISIFYICSPIPPILIIDYLPMLLIGQY